MNKQVKNTLLFVFTLMVYIGLPICILLGLISFDHKFYALTIGAFVVYVVFRLAGYTNEEMGVTVKNWKCSLRRIAPFTIVLLAMGFYLLLSGRSRITPNEHWTFFIFYVFISSPVQEFLYRGVLSAYLQHSKLSEYLKCLIISLLYAFVHIIYRDALTLLLTFIIGIVWYNCYRKDKTLLGVSVSHAILGVVTIIAGVID